MKKTIQYMLFNNIEKWTEKKREEITSDPCNPKKLQASLNSLNSSCPEPSSSNLLKVCIKTFSTCSSVNKSFGSCPVMESIVENTLPKNNGGRPVEERQTESAIIKSNYSLANENIADEN